MLRRVMHSEHNALAARCQCSALAGPMRLQQRSSGCYQRRLPIVLARYWPLAVDVKRLLYEEGSLLFHHFVWLYQAAEGRFYFAFIRTYNYLFSTLCNLYLDSALQRGLFQ